MNQIFFELGGWLSLLGRFSLVLQLAVLVGLFLVSRLWFRRHRASAASWAIVFTELAFLASLGLAFLLLGLLGMPAGLVALVAQLLAIWIGLEILRLLLQNYSDPETVEAYFQRAIRPLFFVIGLSELPAFLFGATASRFMGMTLATAKANPRVLSVPPPKTSASNFGESAIDYELEFSMADPLTKGGISKELRRAIWYAFRDNDIKMPYPQQVLHWAPRTRPSEG
jgi:hypothetical protein